MAAMTTIEKCESVRALRAMAVALMPTMKWRHHGIGVLQAYIAEDTKPEIRLHIWSRKLLKEGMDVSGDIHDHRFDMVSHVLAGCIAHEEIIPVRNKRGTHSMLALTHARAAKDTNYHGPTTPLNGSFNLTSDTYYIESGYSYHFARSKFHRSPLPDKDDVSVTCVEKHNQTSEPARILYPTDKPPVMAFGHEMNSGLIAKIISQALVALKKY